jgi:hypothetical protein
MYSLECLERGVVGKCCSNVLRSLRADGVVPNAVRTCVCERNNTAHVRSSRCAIPYTTQRKVIYIHAYVDTLNTNTHACLAYTYLHSTAQCNSTYHAQTHPTSMHSCEQAMYCTHVSVWSVELWVSTAAMCCAPSVPMELCSRLYAHVCARRAIRRTCVAHDARSHTQPSAHPCIRACRRTKYKHACLPCTYTYLHSTAQCNSTYHAQAHPTSMHSCEQAMYCTYLSVWSVELWVSAAAMCCAPCAPMELFPRLYTHVYGRRTHT